MIDRHLNHLRLAGRRDATIETKRKVLNHIEAGLGGTPLRDATRADLENYLCRNLAPATRKVYRSHMRCFFAWLVEEELRADNPTDRIPSIRIARGVPRPIAATDLTRALSLATPVMRAWLLLMCDAGLRCIEVAHLRPADLETSSNGHRILFLRECKGGGQDTVPASARVVEQLDALPVRNGLWWNASPATVSVNTSQYLHGLGIPATAHQLRHFAGTVWYDASGHDLLTTARLLRHKNAATTQTYAAIDPSRPAEVVRLVGLR